MKAKKKKAAPSISKLKAAFVGPIHPLLVSKGQKPRKGRIGVCEHCKEDFYIQPCHVGQRRFCSTRCAGNGALGNQPIKCPVCGEMFYCSISQQRLRNRRTCSQKCRGLEMARSETRKGPANPFYIHGHSSENRKARYCAAMKHWRQAVFARDNWTCQACGARSAAGNPVTLNADHIKPFSTYPELRYEVSNGRTLCITCHRKTETWGRPSGWAKKAQSTEIAGAA